MAQQQGIPLIGPFLNKLIGTRNDRFVKRYTTKVNAINGVEAQARRLTDAQIKLKIQEFRKAHDEGAKSDDIMVESFAVAREAMDRAVGIRNIFDPKHNFDVSQLPPAVQELYRATKAEMDARPPAPPTGEFTGCAEPLPGWRQVEIPNEIYEAVKALFPESRPPFRARPFDVQLIGGMVLCQGKISEMRTGEGKTIVGPLACYQAAIERRKVHVVTVNDYLVQRDRDWTFPFFHALGLTVGAIHPSHQQDEDEKRVMYRCDVVYGTTAEFGFDYLRDNMKRSVEQQVQRRRDFAIVDEVDSILIDEARTPLIISGPAHEDQPRYDLADKLARHLVDKQRPWNEQDEKVQEVQRRIKGLEGDIRQARDKAKIPVIQEEIKTLKADLPRLEGDRNKFTQYYEVKMERKSAHLTHDGIAEAQRIAGVGSFYVDQNMDLPHLLEQSLRAHAVYHRDKDYVIMNVPDQQGAKPTASVVIVDVFTGRPMIGRQWSDGLHQAIESKEKVPIKQETQTVATVTIQNFFKMYKRLAGMTGTADTEAQEFHDIYKLDVVAIPTNKTVIRRDFDDLVFLVAKDKWNNIVDEIKAFHDAGRPILVGTTSVEKSEQLSEMLTRRHGIHHEVLNAKQHDREAHIIENAGQLGAVMIATNMAGRGTDIKLGAFTREKLLEHWLRRGLVPRETTIDTPIEQLREAAYRKIAPQFLDVKKREVGEVPFADLELQLLRHWAMTHTWVSPKTIEKMSADELRLSLDEHGRFLLHNIRWFNNIEDMGGLHVIGTERHEARRIDNQLRGRSGRQGDKGSSRFFVGLDDDLMKMFAGETTMKILARLGMKEGDAIEHPMLSKSVERAQRKVEERNFQVRKNVLEYDEVMEHQRQTFYGLRQRALEGRDVKSLLFDYIRDATDDAIKTYLDPDYPAVCAGQFASNSLECSIPPDRLRGKDFDEMADQIRREAKADARAKIDNTIGEYMASEGSEIAVDFDPVGLASWAKSNFNIDIDPAELRQGGAAERTHVKELLLAAAEVKIEQADLSGIEPYLVPNYGAAELVKWAKEKFGFEVPVEEILKAQSDEERPPRVVLMDRAAELYRKREIEYPVDFAMETTMMVMRQAPADGANYLVSWANRRFNLGWTLETIRSTLPNKIREQLLAASEQFATSGRLEKEIKDAQAVATDDALDKHLQERLGVGISDSMRYLEGQERLDAIRSRVENVLRAELLYFERTILLDVFDSSWRDHLYAMDQLRDSINFRSFSQQDPRIEYKREGSHLFHAMMETIRNRVTDYLFKAKISPAAQFAAGGGGQRPAGGPPRAPARPQPRGSSPAPAGGIGGSTITGPGLEGDML